jgi:thiol:disulfide interchange protein DsbD
MLARFVSLAVCIVLPLFRAAGQAHTQVELILDHSKAKPGETIIAAIRMRMAPGWHTYWKNPGESGKPTRLKWTLPEGLKAGDIRWPLPEKTIVLDQTIYAYDGEAVLLVPVEIDSKAPNGKLQLGVKASWLECEKLCVPGSAELTANLEVGSVSEPSSDTALFTDAANHLPGGDAVPVHAQWLPGGNDKTNTLEVDFHPTAAGNWDFFPYPVENADYAGASKVTSSGGVLAIQKGLSKFEGVWPTNVAGVMVSLSQDGKPIRGFEMSTAIRSDAAMANAHSASAPVSETGSPASPGFALMLGFAFVGGLILNVMPCVLPVIALKILGFVNQSKKEPGRIRFLGLMYGVGVLTSFFVLASIVIGVKAVGGHAAWGSQFQNPQFIIAMCALVLLVSMNLFGIFEIQIGSKAMTAAYSASSKSGAGGAFFNGVFATLLATPCTAPFLGASLGFAFAQPPGVILLFFLTTGAGLAFPYVLLCWQPAWLKFLPKPGDWMVRFKMAMGFPMLGTAVWLYTLTFNHYGKDNMLAIGLFLIAIALAAWIYGEFVQTSARSRSVGMVVAAVWLLASYAFFLEHEVNWRHPIPPSAQGSQAIRRNKAGFLWEPWSPEVIAKAQKEQRPVLVDFTADWCSTCQWNKRVAIEVPSVLQKLNDLNAITVIADFSLEDPQILEELKKYNRAGVPLVLVYPPQPGKEPIILPEFLTQQKVLSALDRAVN